jgi:hypothetical protein
MNMKQWWNDTDRRKLNGGMILTGENLMVE